MPSSAQDEADEVSLAYDSEKGHQVVWNVIHLKGNSSGPLCLLAVWMLTPCRTTQKRLVLGWDHSYEIYVCTELWFASIDNR